MKHKECPKCKRVYYDLQNFCSKCAVELTKIPNRCSAGETVMCRQTALEDDDVCCTYCGALSVHAAEKDDKREGI